MKTKNVVAGEPIRRGEFVVPRPDGSYIPDLSMKGTGGIARKPYGEWPPLPIAPGESFEILTDGGVQGLVGDKQFWLEIRDGKFRLELHDEAHAADLRQALFQTGYPW